MGKLRLVVWAFAVFFLFVMFMRLFSLNYTGYTVKEEHNVNYILNHLEDFQQSYNDNLNDVPNYIKTVFGNEKINVLIEMNSGKYGRVAIETKKGAIEEMKTGSVEEPTLLVETSEDVINGIIRSSKPADRFRSAMLNGGIKYNAVDVATKVKIKIGSGALRVSNWLGGLVGKYSRAESFTGAVEE